MSTRITNPYNLAVLLRSLWDKGKCLNISYLEEAFVSDTRAAVRGWCEATQQLEWRNVFFDEV